MGKTCPWDTCCNWTKPRSLDAKLDGIERSSIEETKDYCGIVSGVQPLVGFIPINSFALQPGGVGGWGMGGVVWKSWNIHSHMCLSKIRKNYMNIATRRDPLLD